ncbi:unnamed protein product [Fraxinus pennsylvanica]|uniref:Uncharacterized protein n=1 Tax=Fraxinus pennsylvanica TaxID=56036 RepID=A0AAD2A233_9LAMI|nr:unnamed protein product [Fraxinus pennsylvanica]
MNSMPSDDMLMHRPYVTFFYGACGLRRVFSCNLEDFIRLDQHKPFSALLIPVDGPRHCASDLSMSDLKTCLTEFLNIEDVAISSCGFTPTPQKNVIGNVVRIDEHTDPDVRELSNLASDNCLSKCATFPPLGGHKSSTVELVVGKEKQGDDIASKVSFPNGYAKSVNQSCSRSISLPTSSKLVSAMKGSREKQGIPPEELSVTWAPDVYDPVPTAASHVSSNKNHRHRSDSKRYGKNKQKGGGKSSRGSKGKDKKQGERC